MSAPNPENEINRVRREKDRLLKRLLDEMDSGKELHAAIAELADRVTNIEALLENARSNSEKRRGHRSPEPTNQVDAAKE